MANQSPGEIVIVDLFSLSNFPIAIYKHNSLPNNATVIRILSSSEDKLSETTIDEDISAQEFKQFVLSQTTLARYFGSLNNVLENSECDGCYISDVDINTLSSYGIECIPVIPKNKLKKSTGVSFCSGNRISWEELYSNIDVKRFGYDNFYRKIANNVANRKKFFSYIVHDPCSGGTTSALRLGFDLMNKSDEATGRCFVVFLSEIKSPINSIYNKLKELIEDKLPIDTMLVVILDRTISTENENVLKEKLVESTYLASIVRLTHESIQRTDVLNIKGLLYSERADFIKLYAPLCSGVSWENLYEVVDFPLSIQYYNNVKSVNDYVEHWLKEIEPQYRNSIVEFSAIVSVASLYVKDKDRWIDPSFTDTLFVGISKTFWSTYHLLTKKSQEAFKKIFEIELNSEGQPTQRIRTKFTLFAKSLININGLGILDLSKRYVELIEKWNQNERLKYIHDVFTQTSDYDYDYDDKQSSQTLKDKVSQIYKDFDCDSDTILEIYKVLIKYFPEDITCLLSYAQFIYNKAYYEDHDFHDGRSFQEAEEILLNLQDKSDEDRFLSLVYQSLGVLYFRRIGILRFHSGELDSGLYKSLLNYCTICIDNCNKSSELDSTSSYGHVTKAQMILSVLKLKKKHDNYTDWTFCESDEFFRNIYMEYRTACDTIAKHCPNEDSNTLTVAGRRLLNLYNNLDDFRRELNGKGSPAELFRKYSEKLDGKISEEKLRILYGCRLFDSVISSKRTEIRQNISYLRDEQISKIEKATKFNAYKGVAGSFEKLLYLKLFNNRNDGTLDDAIELLKEWDKHSTRNEEKLWINYYYMVFYAIKNLNEGRANDRLMILYQDAKKKTTEFCKKTDTNDNTYPYFYYRRGDTLPQNITEVKKEGSPVQGVVAFVNQNNRLHGEALLDCGLRASFRADRKYNDADVKVTRLEGVVGFRFNGLGLYSQDILEPLKKSLSDETTSSTSKIGTENTSLHSVIERIDLPPVAEDDESVLEKVDPVEKCTSDEIYELEEGYWYYGEYHKEYGREFVTGQWKETWIKYLKVEGKVDDEVYDGDEIEFLPKQNIDPETGKIIWVATEVKLCEDD